MDPNNRIEPMDEPKPGRTGQALVAILGIPIMAVAGLFVSIPAEESGRTVKATVQSDGSIATQHIAGKRYLTAYRDIIGVPTACDGITSGVRLGMTFKPVQCDAMLERELIAHAAPIVKCVPKLYGRAHQIIAAVSLTYNIGTGGFCKSSIAKLWNAGHWRAGCDRFALFDKAGGRVVRGLVLRRARERAECLTGLN